MDIHLLVVTTQFTSGGIKTYLLVFAAWSVNIWWNQLIYILISQHGVSMVKSTRMYWFPQHGVSTFWLNQLIYILISQHGVSMVKSTHIYWFPQHGVSTFGEINTYPLVRPLVSPVPEESTHIRGFLYRHRLPWWNQHVFARLSAAPHQP